MLPKAAILLGASVILAASTAAASMLVGNSVVLTFGKNDEAHAAITFPKDRAARGALTIETFAAGGAGSKLTVSVDTDAAAVLTHVFADKECALQDAKPHCVVTFNGRDRDATDLRTAFREGLVSHVHIETGGKMTMSADAPLTGFSKAMAGAG